MPNRPLEPSAAPRPAQRTTASHTHTHATSALARAPHPAHLGPSPPPQFYAPPPVPAQLHTFAAYFPERPSASQSADAIGFMRAIGSLYPCTHCAEDFRAGMEESPPRAGSRSELSAWMCEAHNRVNRLLGKAEYDCALKNLDARWRTGREGCDAGLDED